MTKAKGEKFSDEKLVKLTLKNEDYFLYLMQRYEKQLLAYIHRLTNVSHEDAEDILQEVFIKIYQNLNDFDKGLKFSSWAYRITHNQIISHWRKIKARPKSIEGEYNENILQGLIFDLDIASELDKKYLNNYIRHSLRELDIKYKEVIILRFFEEKSYEEISDIIKKPKGTVATLLKRAKEQLKDKIKHEQ